MLEGRLKRAYQQSTYEEFGYLQHLSLPRDYLPPNKSSVILSEPNITAATGNLTLAQTIGAAHFAPLSSDACPPARHAFVSTPAAAFTQHVHISQITSGCCDRVEMAGRSRSRSCSWITDSSLILPRLLCLCGTVSSPSVQSLL